MIKLPVEILSANRPEPTHPRTVLSFTDNNVLFLALSADAVHNHVCLADLANYYFFSIWVFFHEHSRITGLHEKGEGISLTPQALLPTSQTLRH